MTATKNAHPELAPGCYRHYKGNLYQVIGVARHSESEEYLVVYHPLYGEQKLWVRPYAMFIEKVDLNGKQVARFERVNPELPLKNTIS